MSDSAVALQIFPTSPATHFDKVDDLPSSPNDDTDYVFASTGSVPAILDMYNLTNHTTETGTINYIQVFTRAKAYPTGQSATGEYKHKITCGTGNALSPNYAPVSTAYQPYSTIWTTRPADGLAWTWADIDALLAGISVASPQIINYTQEIFRPNATGIRNDSTPYGSGNRWDNVDDITSDEDATYNDLTGDSGGSMNKADLFAIPDTILTGTIDDVTVFCRARAYLNGSPILFCGFYAGSTQYWYNVGYVGYSYTTLSKTLGTNPYTGVAWTFTDVNSLQIGSGYQGNAGQGHMRVTQVYAVVNYHTTVSPEVRMTQQYVMVNYSPNPSTVTLLAPNEVSYANARKTERFIFPDGTYCIGDYGRGGKKLSLVGTETTNAIQKMRQVQAMLNNPSPVTISGLLDVNQDMQWRLQDFDFEYDIGGDHYDWTAELSSYDYVEGSP